MNVREMTKVRYSFHNSKAKPSIRNAYLVPGVAEATHKALKSHLPMEMIDVILGYTPVYLNNERIRAAVKLWYEDEELAREIFGPISCWDTSHVTDMTDLFRESHYSTFNEDISRWDVSRVTCMRGMFERCAFFNQPLNGWDVSKVTDMSRMFSDCKYFNQPLDQWDVSRVYSMFGMFSYTDSFNQPIGNWNVGAVVNMSSMFNGARDFNQELNGWNVGRVTIMSSMFKRAVSFNQTLIDWDVSNVSDMNFMFSGAAAVDILNLGLHYWNFQSNPTMVRIFTEFDFEEFLFQIQMDMIEQAQIMT